MLHPKPNRQNTRVRTANPRSIAPIVRPKQSLKVMVAAGISMKGKTDLIIIDEGSTVNSQYYRERILPVYGRYALNRQHFTSRRTAILMQDGARCHTAAASITAAKALFGVV